MSEDLFYVGIKDPAELRKDLLLSSKNLIDSLRRYEKYQLTRDEKVSHIVALKKSFDELLVLNKKLHARLPRVPGQKAPEHHEAKHAHKATPVKVRTKLNVLEDELARVEERLKTLES